MTLRIRRYPRGNTGWILRTNVPMQKGRRAVEPKNAKLHVVNIEHPVVGGNPFGGAHGDRPRRPTV